MSDSLKPRWSNKRLTKEQFVSRARLIWGNQYDYSQSVYLSCSQPITIRCYKHNHFFTLSTAASHIRSFSRPCGCPLCTKEKRKETFDLKYSKPDKVVAVKPSPSEFFLQRMRQVYGDEYDYSNVVYKGSEVPVLLTCRKHGDFKLSPRVMLRGYKNIKPHGCPECAGIRKLSVPVKVKKERPVFDFLKEARLVHGYRYDYPEIPSTKRKNGKRLKVAIICKEHGLFFQAVDVHLMGSNCPRCARRHQPLEFRRDDFIRRAKERYGDKYSYRSVVYVNNDTPVSIYCKEHKYMFSVSPDTHLRGGGGCPYCSNSTGEIDVRLWLEEHDIDFLYQYRIPNSNSNLSLQYLVADFFLPKHKTIIEFQGQQHYFNISHFYRNSKRTFELQLLRDETLRLYCKQNKLNLIEIKYNQQQSIPNILSHILS